MEIRCRDTFNAPVEKVFLAFGLNDEALALFPDILEVTYLNGDQANEGKGTRVKFRQSVGMGRVAEFEILTTEFELNRRLEHVYQYQNAEYSTKIALSPQGEKTYLQFEATLRYKGVLLKIFQPIIARHLAKQLRERMGRVKAHVEKVDRSEPVSVQITLAGIPYRIVLAMIWGVLVVCFSVSFYLSDKLQH